MLIIFWQLIDTKSTHYNYFVKQQLNPKSLYKFNLSITEQRHTFVAGIVGLFMRKIGWYYF